MTRTVRAVYSQGVFKPAAPVPIADGTEVELTISPPSSAPAINGSGIIAALTRIAELPLEGSNDGFSGADHDSILYGNGGR